MVSDRSSRPNILLVQTDQQRFDSLGCYGANFAHTPRLDGLARQGVRFDRCYVNNPICTPSRASMMTGLELPQHGVHRLYDCLPTKHHLFPEHLRNAGYRTGLFGKLHVSDYKHEAVERHPHDGFDVYEWCHEPGLALESPFNGYTRYLKEHHPDFFDRLQREGRDARDIPPQCHMSYWAAEATIDFMASTPENQPFFAMMSLFDPHNPYDDFPLGWDRLIDSARIPDPVGLDVVQGERPKAIERESEASHLGAFAGYDPAAIRAMRHGYHTSVAFLDHQIGRVLDALDRMGLSENTLVIFTSDHGDMLGDRRLLVKGAFFYDACTRVPLIMRWPGMLAPGQVEPGLVQLHDLAATILTAAGLGEVADANMPGALDLAAVASGSPARDVAMCHYFASGVDVSGRYFDPPIYASMARDERYKLNLYWHDSAPPTGQLFDMQCDPQELHDRFDDPAFTEVRRRLEALLRKALDGVAMPRRLAVSAAG